MEFVVNEYITLKLENNKTIMYVNGEEYNLCCGVLVNISGDYPRLSGGDQESVDFIIDSCQYKSTSDDKIRKKLADTGINNLARRTIAKYRKLMNIPPARLRKKY